MARPLQTEDTSSVVPVLAAAALQGGGFQDPEIKDLIREVLLGQAEKRRKEAEKAERMALNAIAMVQEEAASKAARRNTCSHLKQDGRTTRCGGQYVTNHEGKPQLVLVCQYCHTEFHRPAYQGQTLPPQHLIPPPDEIGG